jgi:predicted SprT family Zn-dependent metalloprotease
MNKQEKLNSYKEILIKFIPTKSVDTIANWIIQFKFNLKITHNRNSKLGDYRRPFNEQDVHRITVNHNLNQYAFLITLVHEIAHLTTYEQFNNKHRDIKPHGQEWKRNFKNLIWNFLNEEIFPPEVLHALKNYMNNPAASSCTDSNLQRVLKRYDKNKTTIFLEDLKEDSTFKINGRIFKKGKLRRVKFECKEVGARGGNYLISGLAEVLEIKE